MTDVQRLLARMARIEHNFDKIYVRIGFEAVPFSEVSSKEAMTCIFKWLREVLTKEQKEQLDESFNSRQSNPEHDSDVREEDPI